MSNILETQRLTLFELTRADAPFILDLVNQPSFLQFIGDRGVRTLADAEKYIENGPAASYARNGFGLWRVVSKESGEAIGMCGLIKRETLEDVDVGYAFLPQFWGKGYAFEAVQGVLAYAKTRAGLSRVVAIVDPTNQASIRVLEKAGMQFVKMVRLAADDIELKLFAVDI
jgi:RimJ/RimL family protein N-acetyltransferase